MPPHLKKSINQAHLEIGTYEQIIKHLEQELELNGLETPDELPINNVSQQPKNTNADSPKLTCHNCKKPGKYRNQCRLLKNSENKLMILKIILETKTVTLVNLTRTATSTLITTTTKTVTKLKESQKLFTHPVRHAEKQTNPENFYFGANAANRPPPRHRRPERQNQVSERANQSDTNEALQALAQNVN